MSDMAYCRFENTYHDFKDCVDNLKDIDCLSDNELEYCKMMYELSEKYISKFNKYKNLL